jgi:putative GTP pyrophosphokinase
MDQHQRPSSKSVNRAGDVLRKGDAATPAERAAATEVLGTWRALHSAPLNSMKITLSEYAKRADSTALVAQRLKRAESIVSKLRRMPSSPLSQVQDIAGARAVVRDIDAVRIVQAAYDGGKIRHTLVKEYDYIRSPRDSGYRGVHRRYRFHGVGPSALFDGCLVEIQIRSRVQHAWATAVETMGTFLQTSLKSSEGPDEWLALFKEISAAFAFIENSDPVPSVAGSRREIFYRVWQQSKRLEIRRKFNQFRAALQVTRELPGSPTYFLLSLSAAVPERESTSLQITGYHRTNYSQAISDYLAAEQAATNGENVVLVSAASLNALAAAYPNYFLDTETFLDLLDRVFREARRDAQMAVSRPFSASQLALPGLAPDSETRSELTRMPALEPHTLLRGSKEIARIVWSLELARRSAIGPLTAAELANFMSEWCPLPMHSPNVARAFRQARAVGRDQDLWTELSHNDHRTYEISTYGTAELLGTLPSRL